MTSAEICTYSVQCGEPVSSLQKRIAQDTHIPPASQELLLEAGLALEPHNEIMQCAVDYTVSKGPRTLFLIKKKIKKAVTPYVSGILCKLWRLVVCLLVG